MYARKSEFLKEVWGASPSAVFVAGRSRYVTSSTGTGLILRFDGKKWSPMATGLPAWTELLGLWGTSATDIYAVGANVILRSGGGGWSAVAKPGAWLQAVWGASRSAIFAVGFQSKTARFDGKSWSLGGVGASVELTGVWGTSATNVFAAGGGAIRRFDGAKWTTVYAPVCADLHSVWGDSPTQMYVGAAVSTMLQNSPLLRFDGARLVALTPPPKTCTTVHALWGSSPANVLASQVTSSTSMIMRHDGITLSVDLSAVNGAVQGLWGASASEVFAVGGGGAVIRRGVSGWTHEPLDLREQGSNTYRCPDLHAVWGASASTVFAVGSQGTVLRRCAGGACP